MADATPRRQRKPKAAAAVPSRPKRPKKTLGDDFVAAVRADFKTHGAGVIAAVRADKPDQYLKIVLSVLPKDLHVNINELDALSDDEIRSRIRGLEAVLKPFLETSGPDKPGLERPGDTGRGAQGLSGAAEGTGPQAPR
ncbi:hypothetical protein [Mesorhizobium amorphae]|uniref:hypothetical protein n=1 Tax=Mesorhizobium amorphae TaxID=71433 RepID=UPI001FEE04C3|nr:hypothetical protein [Mesorhizobium amorphae]